MKTIYFLIMNYVSGQCSFGIKEYTSVIIVNLLQFI